MLTNIVLLALWFGAVQDGLPWHNQLVATIIVTLINAMIMRPVRLIFIAMYHFTRCPWRIPRLLPCPEPVPVPAAALAVLREPPDAGRLLHWDPPALRALIAEAGHWMLAAHLEAIASAYELGGDEPLQLDLRFLPVRMPACLMAPPDFPLLIQTHPNSSELIRTHPNSSELIRTHPNSSELPRTHVEYD